MSNFDNGNPILYEFRMLSDVDDWGVTMAFWFAIADYLTDMNAYDSLPDDWEYSQSVFGSDTESYEYQLIDELCGAGLLGEYPHETLLHTGRILARYAALLKFAGREY